VFSLDCTSDITYLSYPVGFKVFQAGIGGFNKNKISIQKDEENGVSLTTDLVLYYKTKDMSQPKLLLQESATHPNEVACMMSFVPTFE
jgi:hypothetical protein